MACILDIRYRLKLISSCKTAELDIIAYFSFETTK